ncbi:hypothetical protein HNQ60_004038 [Povalibacter uvarum]|uniref:Preprotein translocase subunit SecD n=1 Tax=Povalibacter uvarum TaxID=732238 RepID=A0A841HT05_9GAMM|nr:hypothetical protein [Povalibacter uvarum]MBB6095148.1 hypothetical protein [Povalibacter uvarum]
MRALLATLLCWNLALADPLAWQPLETEQLDELRGGFDTGELHASFGIERATYVNGELVARISVEIPDIAAMTPEQASALDQAMNSIVLIQNGPNNSFDTSDVAAGTTVIQNTLNDQHIVTLTTMSADANTLAHFQGLNVNESLQQALNRGVGGR